MNEMKRVSGPGDVPAGEHFAVLVYNTQDVHHEGDERSRTNPGHGYPAYNETVNTFEHWVSTDHMVISSFVKDLEYPTNAFSKKPYVVLKVAGKATIKTSVSLQVG